VARILIVDDAAFMRTTLSNILEQYGHEVVGEAENGDVAVAKYQMLKPDVVTMDITMPAKDGIQALKEIKRLDAGAKIIMCSAMGQEKIVVDAITAGAKDFLVKPFTPERVVLVIEKLMR